MAKKKEEQIVEEVKAEPAEQLLEFTAPEQFIDGSLREDFKRYGYDVNWPQGEKRFIPKWLAKRVLNSGGKLLTKGGEELSIE